MGLLASAIIGCAVSDPATDAGFIDLISGRQCNRQMKTVEGRVADMEELLHGGAETFEVLEDVERLRLQLVLAQGKCTGSETATEKLRKLDRDLERLERRLAVETYK